MNEVTIKLINKFAGELPIKGSSEAAGADVKVKSILKIYNGNQEIEPEKLKKLQRDFRERKSIKLRRFERVLFGTDLLVSHIPKGYEIQVRPRSGLALKRGLTILNSPGTIDSDYQGEIGLIIINNTPFLSEVEFGERMAQLVIAKVENGEYLFDNYTIGKDPIDPSGRGSKGFGSTGTK